MMQPRDFKTHPYSKDEQRVAQFLVEQGVGGGDDPVGFILSSYAYMAHDKKLLQEQINQLLVPLVPVKAIETLDWPPQVSAIKVVDGTFRHGSTGQLFVVRNGQWLRVDKSTAVQPGTKE